MVNLRPFQSDLASRINQAWHDGARDVLGVLPCGAGKCLGKGTPVIMSDGTIKSVEDVRVGDTLLSPYSTSVKVKSTTSGIDELYRVTPIKGDSYVVNSQHILSLQVLGSHTREGTRDRVTCGGKHFFPTDIANVSVTDWLAANKTFKLNAKSWRPSTVTFDVAPAALPIPPYILGAWLGDGTLRSPSMTGIDDEVIAAWYDYAASVGLQVRIDDTKAPHKPGAKACPTYHITGGNRGGRVPNPLIDGLRALGLFQIKKAIPQIYKTANEDARLEMLAGLIDTDGHFGHGMYDITWKSEELANDTAFVARSLGFFAKVSKCLKEATNGNAGKQPYHRVSISGDVSRIPCKVARKKALLRTQMKSVLRSSIDVQPIGLGEYFGFELEGDCKLFLLGDFQVTHNSVVAAHHLEHADASCVFIAHRAELLSGESLALARNGVRHRVIGQPALRRECSRRHVAEGLYDHVDHRARVVIASIQTLVGLPDSDPLWAECRLVIPDECHHTLKTNSYGQVRAKMINARGLGLSATPHRADGKGLGRHADGVFDVLLEGPTAREIELMGFLAPHVIYAPPSDLDLSHVPVTASGDYSPKPLAEATHKSHIMGDVVDHYKRLADGLLGMTFCVDVESSVAIAAAFRAAGVPAEVVTGKTPPDARNAIFRRFRQRQILQLVSCEIAGEGFDLPDVEVVSLARASESYALATQQIGRVKRALPGKEKGIVIDHVGNTTRHCQAKRCEQTGEWYIAVGEREWSLDRRERHTSSKVRKLTLTTCVMCLKQYPRVLGRKCPYCSHETQPAGRSAPEQVDGVLSELDPAALAALQQGIAHVNGAPTIPWGATPAIQGAVVKRHRERQEAQVRLRSTIALWGGWFGRSVEEAQRAFWLQYGTDVGTAQTLGRTEADNLREKVLGDLQRAGVDTVVNNL